MAKILLLDFPEADRDLLAGKKYDVGSLSTGRAAGEDGLLDLPDETEVVFYESGGETAAVRRGLPAGFHETLAERVREGLRFVCFVGGGEKGQLTNIVGPLAGFQIKDGGRGDAVVFNPRALFHVPFERFKPYIAKAYRLLDETLAEGVWEKETPADGKLEILAKTADGAPAALVARRGRGCVLVLPSFGAKTVEVVDHLLKDKLALGAEPAIAQAGEWSESDEYAFPELKALTARRDEEKKRFEETLADYDRQIRELKAGVHEDFLRLLKGEGASLKKAVVGAFRYLGWGRVVDVDEYWKNVIRDREEDAWLIEPGDSPVEAGIRKGELVLVLVRGGKNWATDDECVLLQKYKGRRMQEFGNTRMKAVLVGNYFAATDPKDRANPFSAGQIEEAQKDGNGLLTTYELFRAVKAEKENRISKSALREQIRLKTGYITFDI
ncbi:MAG: hypothetical protein HGA24_07860 [Candidatus Aminicenantes bacterium]|nr:hypothetical protein [Candidatus Aminicenantes bacterium]